MRVAITLATAASIALTLSACEEKKAAPAPIATPSTTTGTGAVVLIDKPNLSTDAAALPRLVGNSLSIISINADLDRMDAAALGDIKACKDAGTGDRGGGWTQWVTRPMTGPDYLTLRVHLDTYCGGPYPSTDQTAVTWDLSTGRRIDWTKAIPGLSLEVDSFEDMPQGYVPTVHSPALGAWYSREMLAGPDKDWLAECRDVFDPEALGEQGFKIWLSGQNGGVSVSPDFAHVATACGDDATLTAVDLRGFDADPKLIQAVVAAQAAHNWNTGEEPDAVETETPAK